MKSLLAAITSTLVALGLYTPHQSTTDDAVIRSQVAAEVVYASFTPAEVAPAPMPPTPAKEPAKESTAKQTPVAVAAPAKPTPKPPQPASVWQRVWVRDGRFGLRGHWEWRLYYVQSGAQQRVQTYQRGSCTGGICR